MTAEAQHSEGITSGVPRRRTWWIWGVVLLAIAAIAATIVALGGLDDVPIEDLPELRVGDVHSGSDVETTITSIHLAPRAPGQSYDPEEGTQYLVVAATLSNISNDTTTMTLGLLRAIVEGEIEAVTPPDRLTDPRTAEQVAFLQPGLPVDALFSWKVTDAVKPGNRIVLGLFDRFPVYGDPLWGDDSYSTAPTARIVTTIGRTG